MITHRMSGTTEYEVWKSMKKRCDNQNCDAYKHYGGRGITYDNRWSNFKEFYDDMGDRPKGTTLDRIDNNGNYSKDNCKWATVEEQQNNKRTNRKLTLNGVVKTIAEWSRELDINETTISERLRVGLTDSEALTRPLCGGTKND